MPIHPTAIVDPTAEIDPTADIGAYAIIEGDVHIGAETRLYPHAFIARYTTIGRRCRIHPFAVVGHLPQDVKFGGAPSRTCIGDDTIVREHATIHRGTLPESVTSVGHRCFLMAGAHVGHNCTVADDAVLVNGVLLAGHVEVGPGAFVSGNSVIHQFVRIGELAMIGGGLRAASDVPPFLLVGPAGVVGPNVVGLRRAGLSAEERNEIRRAYRILYRSGLPFPKGVEQVAALVQTAPGRRLVEFLRGHSRRGFARLKTPRGEAVAGDGE